MKEERVIKATSITGTWDNSADIDTRYTLEFAIPLDYAIAVNTYGGIREEDIWANIIIADHDKNRRRIL